MNTLVETLQRSVAEFGDQTALVVEGQAFSFRALERAVRACAATIKEIPQLGATPISVVVQPSLPSIAALLAVSWLGRPVLVVDDPVRLSPSMGLVVDLQTAAKMLSRGEEMLSRGVAVPSGADAPVLLLTSGTSGPSKAAIQPLANFAIGGDAYREIFNVHSGDTILATVPLAHSFGMVGGLWLALRSGARLLHTSAFPPRALLHLIADHRPRLVLGAPLVYDICARCELEEPLVLTGSGALLSSGAALPTATDYSFRQRFGVGIISLYGSTETGLIATARAASDVGPGQVGRPAPGVEVRLLGVTGGGVINEPAELEVRTPTMFLGYLDDPETTAHVLVNGWYRTGDLAILDAIGEITLVGRKSSFINVAGRKVDPIEVAEVLRAHPAVADARVFGRKAAAAGEHLVAEVVLRTTVAPTALAEWCRTRLPSYMQPVEFIQTTHLRRERSKLSAS